jgi:hypothetical protein
MIRLVLRSWLLLLYLEFVMRFQGFKKIHETIRSRKTYRPPIHICPSAGDLCHAADIACIFYFKRVYCLQRSAVTTLLLRRFGFDAEMVIGAQLLPFRSHAWVEIGGTIVNDKPYMLDIYRVLERC